MQFLRMIWRDLEKWRFLNMKKLVLIGLLSCVSIILKGNESAIWDCFKSASSLEVLNHKVEACLNEMDEGVTKKICYRILFKFTFLFLNEPDELLKNSSFISVQPLRECLFNYLIRHAKSDLEKCFLEKYKAKYLTTIIVPTNFPLFDIHQDPLFPLRLISFSHQYTLDPFYVAFVEFNKEEATVLMNYLITQGIDITRRMYFSIGAIIELIARDFNIPKCDLEKYCEIERS